MPTIVHRCTQCGGKASQSFGERVVGRRLAWYESWHCAGCHASEADGFDRLPDDLRSAVLASDGAFRVHVVPVNKLGLLRILRDELGMSLPDAMASYARLPGFIERGMTRVEAELLAKRFDPSVADALVECDATDPET